MLIGPTGVRVRALVAVGAAVALVGWLLQRVLSDARGLPATGWFTVLVLGSMAALVYAAGRRLERSRTGAAAKPLSALQAARTLVLAQSAALAGAALAGWYVAGVVSALPDVDVASQRDRLWPLVASLLASAVVAAVGMHVQSTCRIDPPAPSA